MTSGVKLLLDGKSQNRDRNSFATTFYLTTWQKNCAIPSGLYRKLFLVIVIILVVVLMVLYSCLNCRMGCTRLCLNSSVKNFPFSYHYIRRNETYYRGVTTDRSAYTNQHLPHCIIIGVRKAGTRALLEYLSLHPDIAVSHKEQHFFNVDDRYKMGVEYYRAQMPKTIPHQITVEKTPAYFTDLQTPERIYRMNNTIRLLLIVKEPVTRLISDYTQLMYGKLEKRKKIYTLEQLVLDSNGEIDVKYKPLQRSIYYRYLTRWLEFFRRDQIHIIDGDYLTVNPYAEISAIETFLGVGHKISKTSFYFNASKGFFCINDDYVETPCLSETKGRPHPKVEKSVLELLYKFYRPWNKLFFDMTNRTFNWP